MNTALAIFSRKKGKRLLEIMLTIRKNTPDTKRKIAPFKMSPKALKNRITNSPIATIWKTVVHRASALSIGK